MVEDDEDVLYAKMPPPKSTPRLGVIKKEEDYFIRAS
jgi:hypothetical protein